jgi:RNase P subunit RPR2
MNFIASDKKERERHELARQKIKMVAEIALRPRLSLENQFSLIN